VGAKEAIFAAMMATIGPGDEVIVPDPCWVSYVPCIELAGGKPVWQNLVTMPEDPTRAWRIQKIMNATCIMQDREEYIVPIR
jgi:aspartate/methionine/tyrosine aminotransferase